jgi:hypothetical protein
MNTFLTAAVIALAPLLGFALALPGPHALAGDKGKKEPVKKIPLQSIYATIPQEGVKHVERGRKEMAQILDKGKGLTFSNIFLVPGKDINAAIAATHVVFTESVPPEFPDDPGTGIKDCWLVAYFGLSGGGSPTWQLESVEMRDRVIQLKYSEPEGSAMLPAALLYFAWVPVGTLTKGTYTLELFDVGQKTPTLLRRFTINGK